MIDAALEAARTGSGGMVLVEGEAGIGKTSLLALASARALEAGMRVLSGRGGPLEREFAFGVVRQLLEPELTRRGARGLLEGAAGPAASVLSLDAPESPASAPDLLRALHALYWFCSNLAERAALLMAIDDVHWADVESLRWLSYMVNRVEDLPLLLVAAQRPGETSLDEAALAAAASAPRVERLRLAPLGERASSQIVRGLRGGRVAAEFCRACHAASAGNPFYLRELVLETEEQRIAPVAAQAERVALLGPSGIAIATLVRIARLPAACAALARAVATLGLDVELRDAAALASLEIDPAEQAADALAAAGILRRARPLNFKHPVVAAAIYDDTLPGARSRAHARAAELLAERGAGVETVASHLLLVEPAADAIVMARLRAAAAESLGRGAPVTAASYLRRALAETGDSKARVEVLLELGRAELMAGEASAIVHLRELMQATTSAEVLLDATLLVCSALMFADRSEEAAEVVERMTERLGYAPDAPQALRLASCRIQATWDNARWVAGLDEELPSLIAKANTAGDAGRSLLVCGAAHAAARGEGTSAVATWVERAFDSGAPISGEFADSLAPGQAISVLAFVDQLDAADELLDRLFGNAQERGSVLTYVSALVWRGLVALRRGLVLAAETDERAAAELAQQHGMHFALPWAQAFLADALLERGMVEAAGEVVDELRMTRIGRPSLAGIALDARGRVRIAQGRREEGIADLRSVGQVYESIGVRNPNVVHWRSSLGLALGRGSAEGLRLVTLELERARGAGSARATGVALCARGLLEGGERGVATLGEAVAVLEDSPARLEHARALFHLGSALRRIGERARGREPLRRALDLADRFGAEGLAGDAQAELAAAGGRPRRRQLSGLESLTPTERRIADLAAAGKSNKQIAQALFVSRKTVEMHLGHTYRKLDIHSREELAETLAPVATGAGRVAAST